MASLDCTLVVVVASPVAVAVVMADAVELAEPVVDGSGVADDNPDAAAADVATATALAAGTQSLPAAAGCLLYTSPSPRDLSTSRMPSSA